MTTRVFWRHAGERFSKKFKTKDEADLFRLQLKLGIADKKPARSVCPTFDEFSVQWIRDYCKVEKAESQWIEDERIIANHLSPAFGSVRLNALKKSHLMDLRASLSVRTHGKKNKPMKPKTINLIIGLAKKMMSTACDYEYISKNPFKSVKFLKVPQSDFKFWTTQERDHFISRMELVDQEIADLVTLACHTGLRLGELWALERSDLDFKSRKIRVTATFNRKLRKRMSTTKNKTCAWVPMNNVVYQCLLPKRFLKENARVFPERIFLNTHRWMTSYAKACGVRVIRFHDLRHTFASHLAMAGVDLFKIQTLMRHKDYKMTLRYAHLHPSHLVGATDVLCGTHMAHGKKEDPQAIVM